MSGRLTAETSALTVRLTTNTSHTTGHGSVRSSSARPGSEPKASTANRALSSGTLARFDTATRAHWWAVVTRRTNQWYTSVSTSSLITSAMIDATTIRHSGPSTVRNSSLNGYDSSGSTRAAHCR